MSEEKEAPRSATKPITSESEARAIISDEAARAAQTEYWPKGSSNEELKFMLESVMGLVQRQNTTIRQLQKQVTELWRENTVRGRGTAWEHSDKLVVVGFTQYVEAFSHDTGDWRELKPMPTGRRDCAAGVVGDKLYVLGGTSNATGSVVDTVEIYDCSTREWSTGPRMGRARASAAAVEFLGKLVVVGGTDDDRALKSVEMFDPDTGRWSALPDMSVAREGPGAAVLDRKLFVCGGKGAGASVAMSDCEHYDPSTGNWSATANLPKALGLCSAAVYNGQLVCAGNGQTVGGGLNMPGAVYVLEETRGKMAWRAMPDRVVTAEATAVALEVLNGSLVAVASAGVEEFDPVTSEWHPLPQSRVRHFGCDAAVIPPAKPSSLGTPRTPVIGGAGR